MPRHLTLAELREGLPEILRSPKDNGTLAGIVIRPEKGVRRELEQQRGNWAPAGDNLFIDLDLINRTGDQ